MVGKSFLKAYSWLDDYRGKRFEGKWPTIPELFVLQSERYPSKNCFETFQPSYQSFTYGKSMVIIRIIADRLKKAGLAEGDKVALSGKNSPEWALAYIGILFAGCVVVPLDTLLSGEEIENLSDFADIRFAFIDADKLKVFSRLNLYGRVCLEKDGACDGFDYLMEWVEMDYDDCSGIPVPGDENATAAILFTSGTTGKPKGVMLSHANFMADAFYAQSNMRILESDVFYALLPIHHAYSMLSAFIVPMTQGASVIFGKRMVTRQIFSDIKSGKVTIFFGVPALFNKMISSLMSEIRKKSVTSYVFVKFLMGFFAFLKIAIGIDFSHKAMKFVSEKIAMDGMRICISGGGPLPEKTFRMFNRLGVSFVQGYGMTETSPIIALNPTYAYKVSSVGKIIENTAVKIVDPDRTGNGLIFVKGEIVMKGYYRNEDGTAEVMDSDGYINTGDIGHLDKRNYLYLTGRAKNIIVTAGGKNVFPEEIEDEFQLFPEIDQIMVAGYSQGEKGEGIRAIVHPSSELIRDCGDDKEAVKKKISDIVALVNRKLSPYKKISKVEVVDEPLEMTSSRKIKRAESLAKLDDG